MERSGKTKDKSRAAYFYGEIRADLEEPAEEPAPEKPAAPPADIVLLTEIRDALRK